MKSFKIPYGDTFLTLEVPKKNLKAVIEPRKTEVANRSEVDLVKDALANPIFSPKLSEICKGKKDIVLITSDHTRSVPSKITLPLLLEEIRKGSPDADISILVATGLHRATTKEEQRKMFGDDIVDKEKIYVHDSYDDSQMLNLGVLPNGAVFEVNKRIVECDVLLAEGFIEPHFFAGFSGGRKSVFPGVSSHRSVSTNHSYKALASKYATAGILENNPIHEDMLEAAKRVNLQFILNVALDDEKKIIAAFAGDLEKAHEQDAILFVKPHCVAAEAILSQQVMAERRLTEISTRSKSAPLLRSVQETTVSLSWYLPVRKVSRKELQRSGSYGSPEIDAYLSKIPPIESIPEQWVRRYFRDYDEA